MKNKIDHMFDYFCIPRLNSELFSYENHNDDNSIVEYFEDLLYEHRIAGYTSHPSFREYNGYGVMFEKHDGLFYWCHMPEELLETIVDIVQLKLEANK